MTKAVDIPQRLDQQTSNETIGSLTITRESLNAQIARMLYMARTQARLTQQELAELVGTTQSVISRLEDADYAGHSLSMLQRVATALNKRLMIQFTSVRAGENQEEKEKSVRKEKEYTTLLIRYHDGPQDIRTQCHSPLSTAYSPVRAQSSRFSRGV